MSSANPPLHLRVDVEWLRAVSAPHLVDIVGVIVSEERRIHHDSRIRAKSPERSAVCSSDDKLIPSRSIDRLLGYKSLADSMQPVAWYSWHRLRTSRRVRQSQAYWQADEVDVRDIGKELCTVEREFAETPVLAVVQIGGVAD